MLDAALLIAQSNIEVKTGVGGGLLFAILCAVIAPGRGRSALAWFFLGLFFTCLSLIILLLLPNLKDTAEQERRAEKEVHRLREQVKKERQVADQRHDGNRARLDVHDRALGVDTSDQEPPQLPGDVAVPLPPPPPGAPESVWLLATAQEQFGPFSTSEVRQFVIDGRIDHKTLVWREGMATWLPLGSVPELSS